MKFNVDQKYLIDCFEKTVNVPSPVGYSLMLNPLLEDMAKDLGLSVTYDNKSTAYITLEGKDTSKTVLVGAHADTVGYVVRSVDQDGMLIVRKIGGVVVASSEGTSVTVITRDKKQYSGTVICKSHSPHAFLDAHTLERNEDNVRILLDEEVKNKQDVRALGIQNGDVVAINPDFEYTENGYLKSRFIDDKGAIACVFTALKYMQENGLKPAYNTVFAFPYTEELGLGGAYVPDGVSEYVAVDIGLIAPGLEGNERSVSICASDMVAPYDYELTSRIVDYAKKADCPYALDVFVRYSTDGNAAIKGGNNLRAAAFGMAVYCSHGRERTHIDGLQNTTGLILAYILDI